MNKLPRIVITPGEPAGVGPDVVIQLAREPWPAELIAVCDPDLLIQRAQQLNIPLSLENWDANQPASAHCAGTLKIIPIRLNTPSEAGKLNVANAPYVIECLKTATDTCLKGQAQALVTGPVHKSIINDAHIPFTGHTEYLAQCCQVPEALMLFVVGQLKVALATTHLPLTAVSQQITPSRLKTTLRLLHSELQTKFGLSQPRIMVCGLNPHAGEAGHLGREEIDVIQPVLAELQNEMNVFGPLPADTVFTEKQLQTADAVLAMYHDQALPVVKYMSFGHAVNVTLGLPIIRTSVDHGTALDVAGTLKADPGSLAAALKLAITLASH